MSTEAQPHLSILRIKRRRTDNPTPLDALGIFRFAETVPLDSFSSPTKTRNLKDRIQSFIAHPPHARSASSPLSRVGSSTSLRSAFRRSSPSDSPSAPSSPVPGTASPSGRKLPSSLRAARAAAAAAAAASSASAGGGSGADSPRRAVADEYHDQARQLRYRIVAQQRDKLRAEERRKKLEAERERRKEEEEVRRGLRPPRVLDSREIAREKEERERKEREKAEESDSEDEEGLRIYEAVAEELGLEVEEEREKERERRRRERERQKARAQKAFKGASEQDQQKEKVAMDQFGDMLREYLTLQDSITPSPAGSSPTVPNLLPSALPPSSSRPSAPASASSSDAEDGDDPNDYVYDVYYRAVPPTATTSAAAAEKAADTEAATAEGSGWDVSSLEGLKRIGQLAGFTDPLTDPADLADELLMHEQEGDLTTEEEDEADQDSNEENDYRNDYPEGEDQPFSSDDEDEYGAIPARRRAAAAESDGDGGSGDGDSDNEDESDEDDEGDMRMSGGGFGARFGGWRGRGGGEEEDEDY
ncbi:hypothetical protein JCM6882_008680 [Rhodosporidiobolus microsporus]